MHGYTVATARTLALEKLREAWEHGCETVTFIHGARDAYHHFLAVVTQMGYGTIKWRLRSMLRNGEFQPYARGPHSRRHRRDPVKLTIALRPNPSPNHEAPWSDPPAPEHPR